jgi:hypothetical protein
MWQLIMNVNLKTSVGTAVKGCWGHKDRRIMEIDLSDNYGMADILTHVDFT